MVTLGSNIREMEAAGHPHDQAVAASLDKARKSGAKIPKPRQGQGAPATKGYGR